MSEESGFHPSPDQENLMELIADVEELPEKRVRRRVEMWHDFLADEIHNPPQDRPEWEPLPPDGPAAA